jgi:FKBP-type peptidyl-prolyl cis-trans isomerase
MSINHNPLIFIIAILVVLMSSCNEKDFKTGETGYQYKIVRNGDGPLFENNNYILMYMDYYYEDDSLLFTWTEKNIPVTLQYIDTIWERSGPIYHGLKKLKVGDSAIFKVKCSDLYEVAFRGNIPYGLNPFSDITVEIGIMSMLEPAQFRLWKANLFKIKREEIQKRKEQQLLEDISLIDIYMEEQGLVGMELESGIRYIIHEDGSGKKPEKGDQVLIHFNGYLLDGTQFDSSYDRNEPYEFTLGARSVISGWEESVAEMTLGSKITFYLPSELAYGERGLGEMVNPNTVVVFDLELLDIKKKGN